MPGGGRARKKLVVSETQAHQPLLVLPLNVYEEILTSAHEDITKSLQSVLLQQRKERTRRQNKQPRLDSIARPSADVSSSPYATIKRQAPSYRQRPPIDTRRPAV